MLQASVQTICSGGIVRVLNFLFSSTEHVIRITFHLPKATNPVSIAFLCVHANNLLTREFKFLYKGRGKISEGFPVVPNRFRVFQMFKKN